MPLLYHLASVQPPTPSLSVVSKSDLCAKVGRIRLSEYKPSIASRADGGVPRDLRRRGMSLLTFGRGMGKSSKDVAILQSVLGG